MEKPDDRFYEILGSIIKDTRKERHFTVRDLADKLSKKGGTYSRSTLSLYERGSSNIVKDHHLEDICAALSIDPKETYNAAYIEWHKGLENKWAAQADYDIELKNELDELYSSFTDENKRKILSYAEFLKSQQ